MFALKNAALTLSILSTFSYAGSASYQSIANELTLKSTGQVLIKALLVNPDDLIDCANAEHDFHFELNTITGQKWYDILLLSRNSNSLVEFHYDDQNCQLSAIKLLQIYAPGSEVGEEGSPDKLKETGERSNVALINSNGLSTESYDASDFYGQDAPSAAFDGYIYSVKDNQDGSEKIARGIWIARNIKDNGDFVQPWLQVDFGKDVALTGLAILLNKQSLELGRGPRDILIHAAKFGEELAEIEALRMPLQSLSTVDFTNPITARFFRIEVLSNYGDRKFVEIDELELYQE
jgi:hypothetical protein